MPQKNGHKFRSISEKYKIIKFYESLLSLNKKKVKIKNFNISCISTLNGILEKKNSIIDAYENQLISSKRKSLRKGNNDDIDQRVYEWFV